MFLAKMLKDMYVTFGFDFVENKQIKRLSSCKQHLFNYWGGAIISELFLVAKPWKCVCMRGDDDNDYEEEKEEEEEEEEVMENDEDDDDDWKTGLHQLIGCALCRT